VSELPATSVTVADLYRELVGMRTDVAKVLTRLERVDERNHQADMMHTDHEGRIRTAEHEMLKLTSASDGLTQRAADTEGRLRSLEKFRFQVVGALFVINALAVIIEQLIRRR
jgi:hypothetical protein